MPIYRLSCCICKKILMKKYKVNFSCLQSHLCIFFCLSFHSSLPLYSLVITSSPSPSLSLSLCPAINAFFTSLPAFFLSLLSVAFCFRLFFFIFSLFSPSLSPIQAKLSSLNPSCRFSYRQQKATSTPPYINYVSPYFKTTM